MASEELSPSPNKGPKIDSGLFAGLSIVSSQEEMPSSPPVYKKEMTAEKTKDTPTPSSPPVTNSPATNKLLKMLDQSSTGNDDTIPSTPSPKKPTTTQPPPPTTPVLSSPSSTAAGSPQPLAEDLTKTPIRTNKTKAHSRDALVDEAFHVVTDSEVKEAKKESRRRITPETPQMSSRVGKVHQDTPIPNCDVALRLLRKFATKTRSKIPTSFGGTKSMGILGFVFGNKVDAKEATSLKPYSELMKIILTDDEQQSSEIDEADIVVESILGGSGDSMTKARLAVAAFVNLTCVWCHASQGLDSKRDAQSIELLAQAMDSATALVAHGCLDDVKIEMGTNTHRAVQLLSESIFVSDLSLKRTELASLKFLLTTGCRSTPGGDALLRGTHLLQSIRVLYHIYLTTDSESNKTTARASLQQLVTSVFKRMLIAPRSRGRDSDGFPSRNHRDAFLVLRSMCKLSMRTLPDSSRSVHTGLQASGSSVAWDGGIKDQPSAPKSDQGDDGSNGSSMQVVSVHSIHPALESKILALELLLYVLQNTDMSGSFLQNSGPQFQYAIRNYLCVSLLKNCTSDTTKVVNLSLRLFVPLIRNFRSHLKAEIEAFVTNVFFVILDSKHSTIEHKSLVVVLFEEICSDPQTLAEIFLNYDCDLSAVDLFHRIVNTLSRVAKTEIDEATASSMSFVAGAGAVRMEKMRNDNRQLRLEAMRALRQVLASLHASIVEPMVKHISSDESPMVTPQKKTADATEKEDEPRQNLVQIYDSKKKRRAEESEAVLRFNKKPSAGIKYAAVCGHIDADDPADVSRYLLKNKDLFDKTQIGEYLGREPDYQNGFSLKVLHAYVNLLDFTGLLFDDAIKYYLSGFRLPGEAQKIDRIMEKFAERYTNQNPSVFPTADAAFILAFSIIMLNTDLHNPAIKEERRMTKEGFIRNNRGICDGQDLPEELLTAIFDRIKSDPISLKEDDEAREKVGSGDSGRSIQAALSPAVFFSSHYDDMDKDRENNFQKERDHIVRTTESLLKGKKRAAAKEPELGKPVARHKSGKTRSSMKFVRKEDTGLRDEYVGPMFEVTWGPALAAFSTAMESANGTMGSLLAIATDDELESAAANAAETIEICLTGFRFAVCTAGLCGNHTARDAFMLALSRFTQLGTGTLLEPRHVRCIQTLISLGKDDGELLGNNWEHIFKALSEVHRFHELFQLMARNDRAAAAAAERRLQRQLERERRQEVKEQKRRASEAGSTSEIESTTDITESEDGSLDSDIFSETEDIFLADEEMDKKAVDEANARVVYDAVSESLIDAIYQRSASLSGPSIKEFVFQLCRVSRMEIAGYGGHAGSEANTVDLTQVHYRQQHTLLNSGEHAEQPHHNQPDIYNLQKLVEVTHYNMDSRPRLVFSDIWSTVAAHLTSTALHSNAAVAMYAVDSFRQLSTQYLQREELGGFEFQRRFLKPFEAVMAKSQHVSIKELLLKCVERIVLMFGANVGGTSPNALGAKYLGTLRSGWRPVLTVLGLAGKDSDEGIADLGFKMLTAQLRQCLSVEKGAGGADKPKAGVLLAERFVDIVSALLMYVAGPHESMSLLSIDHLVTLTTFLADESFAFPLTRRRGPHNTSTTPSIPAGDTDGTNSSELELWWPILLGLSRSIGDSRKQIRLKSLMTLLGLINQHFFPEAKDKLEGEDRATSMGDLQTLQLIFRGVLTPVLEHADTDSHLGPSPPLPDDFERFTTKPPDILPKEKRNLTWLETTFEHFMDGCIGMCMRAIKLFDDDSLVEEIFAMLNSCLLSDSGGLAVRGLRRLEQFVTKDLQRQSVTDDTWATVCHMLRRCISVRGLPAAEIMSNGDSHSDKDEEGQKQQEIEESILEFTADEKIMQDRRYIGSNVTLIIGKLLSSEQYSQSLGIRWRLFLTNGLGRGVKEWERAEALLSKRGLSSSGPSPPSYIENAIYGRKWMSKLMLQVVAMDSVISAHADPNLPSTSSARSLIKEQTQSLITLFLEKEACLNTAPGEKKALSWEAAQLTRLTKLVLEFVSSLESLEDSKLMCLSWLTPMLSCCMNSRNESVRKNVHRLQKRMLKNAHGDQAKAGE